MKDWNGLLLLNKPPGVTSHTVVQAIKERLKAQKAGHLGTLDPLATGVFPVALGKATRLTPFYMGADKCYISAIRFGFYTDTDDREGQREGRVYPIKFSEEELREAVASFRGEYEQIPPSYSAKKIKGKKAYELARKGIKPELRRQKVEIKDIRLLHYENQIAVIFVHCGSGTYVRSLARAIGEKLNCGAHVHELTRTRFGQFDQEQTCSPDAPLKDLIKSFVPIDKMLSELPEIIINVDQGRKILTGAAIEMNTSFQPTWVRIFDTEKSLLALAHVEDAGNGQRLKPKIVLQ